MIFCSSKLNIDKQLHTNSFHTVLYKNKYISLIPYWLIDFTFFYQNLFLKFVLGPALFHKITKLQNKHKFHQTVWISSTLLNLQPRPLLASFRVLTNTSNLEITYTPAPPPVSCWLVDIFTLGGCFLKKWQSFVSYFNSLTWLHPVGRDSLLGLRASSNQPRRQW